MLSGLDLEEEAKERGAEGLLRKPFNGAQLLETVAAAFDRTGVTTAT